MAKLAKMYSKLGQAVEAKDLQKELLDLQREFLDDDVSIAYTLDSLASTYDFLGQRMEAKELQMEALDVFRRMLSPGHPAIATSLNNLGSICSSLSLYSDAEAVYKESLSSNHGQPESLQNIASMGNLAAT